jgi:hypothetical protein
VRRFGEIWDAPICDATVEVDTPIGQRCLSCQEPVGEGDQGFIHPVIHADGSSEDLPIHRECELLGVIGHSYGYCHCTNYQGNSRRIGALLLWAEFHSEGEDHPKLTSG